MNRARLTRLLGLLFIALCAARYGHHHVYQLALHHTANDFGHQFLAARAILTGLSPYQPEALLELARQSGVPRINPFVYPPFAGLLLLPFCGMTFRDAYFWWTALNQLLLFASLGLLVWGFPILRQWVCLAAMAGLVAFSEPLWRSYSAGQLNTVLLVLLVGALVSLARGRSLPAAVLIALAAHVKVTPAFLMLIFVWKRDLRGLAAGVATLLALFLLTLLWVPFAVQREYLDLLPQMGYGSSTWAEYGQNYQVEPANQSLSALAYRLFTNNPRSIPLWHAPGLAKALSVLSALALLALVGWRLAGPAPLGGLKGRARWAAGAPSSGPRETTLAFLLLWWVVLPTPSLCWDHYLAQLLPHLALLFAWLHADRSRWGLLAWLLAAALISRRVPFWEETYRQGWGILWGASKLYGMLILGGLLLRQRPQAAEAPGVPKSPAT